MASDIPPAKDTDVEKWSRIQWFTERKTKIKLTLLAISLVTIAFYAVILFGKPLEWFTYYAVFMSLLTGAMQASDVLNTMSYNSAKSKKAKPI